MELIRKTEYEAIRSRYELAFRQLARAVESLQDLEESGAGRDEILLAVERTETAHFEYRQSRDKLADYLMARADRKGAARPQSVESRKEPDSVRIRKQAYSLWERAGKPIGNDQADWFRAEADCRAPYKSAGA